MYILYTTFVEILELQKYQLNFILSSLFNLDFNSMMENEELPELQQESVMIGLIFGLMIAGISFMLWSE